MQMKVDHFITWCLVEIFKSKDEKLDADENLRNINNFNGYDHEQKNDKTDFL